MDVVQDPELAEMVEMETRELLTKYGFPGEKATIVKGSAKTALEEAPGKDTDIGRKSILKLVEALDGVASPSRPLDKPFLLPIEDVLSISGRGTVITGRIEQGVLKVGDDISIIGAKPIAKINVTGIEMFRKQLDSAQAGDNIGALLRGVKREDIQRGEVACKPGSIVANSKFKAKVYLLTTDEGGRKTPFGTSYKPQFFIRTANITGSIVLEKDKMAMPGDTLEMDIELIHPVPLQEGMRFAIREGSLTVGAGVISKIIA